MRVACVYFETETNLQAFAEVCLRFSPQICLRRESALFIEIGKCRTLYREDTFLLRMKVLLKKFEIKARVAIEDNVVLSLLSAIYETTDYTRLPLSSLHYFSDPFAFSENDQKLILKMVESFRRLGIKTIADFLSIPAHELPSRFGALGTLCRERVLDSSHLTWPAWTPSETIEESLELSYDDYCATIEPLVFKSKNILDRLFARLKGRGLRLSRIRVEVKLENVSFVKDRIRAWDFDFMLPQGSSLSILPILRERWDRDLSRNPLQTNAVGIRFEVRETAYGYEMQKSLFHNREESFEALNGVMAHLSEILGKTKVFHAVLKEERLPELSWKKRECEKEVHADIVDKIPGRPLKVCPTPLKLQVTKDRIFLKKKSYTVTAWSEVERISNHWLDGEISRNYYKVSIVEGPALWVFKDAADDYFLHGWFE
ncbi:MAG: hypothetical protein H7333_04925 [Bdellovibrionales bacterium]|nr:hypothetical protein [Oligoflexia bacterium]